jgi:rhodanese-related sulfurtransferase
MTTQIERISVQDVKKRMDRGERIFFIDTRNPVAWADTSIKIRGAVRMHYEEIEKRLKEVPRDRPIVTYCT